HKLPVVCHITYGQISYTIRDFGEWMKLCFAWMILCCRRQVMLCQIVEPPFFRAWGVLSGASWCAPKLLAQNNKRPPASPNGPTGGLFRSCAKVWHGPMSAFRLPNLGRGRQTIFTKGHGPGWMR